MPTDKLLHRIQIQIDELAPTLELFVDDTIQPSVQDCENLQRQLTAMQENIAIYKYNKQNKELSPSFNIHAKVSEKEAQEEKKAEVVKEIKESIKLEVEEKTEITHQAPVTEEPQKTGLPKPEDGPAKPPLTIGINDKFRFMNELFSQNSSEYNIALEQLNSTKSWNEAEIYLNSLKTVYEWEENDEVVKYFFLLVKKRFD